MARYPQGVKTFIPQIQPYQVDFNFANNVLKTKQNQYDTNWKQLNKLYGQIYYANLTREESKEKQEALVKQIDFNLKRISTMDLSLDQNVQAAKQIFQPFYEDKNLMKDIAWTKNTSMALSGAESLRNSSDEEQRARYWQDGVNAINYRIDEFKETPYDQIQSQANVRYTNYVDVMAKADAISKEFGDHVTPSFSEDNRWILNTTNGEQLRPHLQKLFQIRMANDPAIQEMYKTQAYVDRKNYMYQNAAEYGGDKQAAELAYLDATYNLLKPAVIENNEKLKKQDETYTRMIKTLQNRIDSNKQTLNTGLLLQDAEKFKNLNDGALVLSEKEYQDIKEGRSTLSTSTGPMNAADDISLLRTRVDSLRANQLMRTDFLEAADVYAFRNFKQELEVNDYEMENVKQQNRLALAKYEQDRADTRQKNLTKAENLAEYQKYIVDTGQGEYYFDEYGNRQVKIFEELDEVTEGSNPLTSGTFDVGEALIGNLTVQENMLSNEALAGLPYAASLGMNEDEQRSLFSGMTIPEAQEYLNKTITETGDFNILKVTEILAGLQEVFSGDNKFSAYADELYDKNSETGKAYNAYKDGLSATQIDIDAYAKSVNHQVFLTDKTFQALEQQGGNSLAGILAVNPYGFKVDDEEYYAKVNALAKLTPEELDDIKRKAREPEMEQRDDAARATAWAMFKTMPSGSNLTIWAGHVLADWADANNLASNSRARDFIPFKSTIDKLRGKGAPTPASAHEKYQAAYKQVAEELGNPIMYKGKIGTGDGSGISSTTSNITVHPLALNGDNYSRFYEGTDLKVVPVVSDLDGSIDLADKTKYTLSLDGTGLDQVGLDAEAEYEGGPTDSKAVLSALDLITDKALMSELKQGGRFTVESTVSTAYDGNLSAYVIKPSQEFVEKYATKRNKETGAIEKAGYFEASQGAKMLTNGITVMAPQGTFKSDLYHDNFQDQVTKIIKASPDKTYVIRNGKNTLTWKENAAGALTAETNVQMINIPNFINNPSDFENAYYMSNDLDKGIIMSVGEKSTDAISEQFLLETLPTIKNANDALVRKGLQLLKDQYDEQGRERYTKQEIIYELNKYSEQLYGYR